MKPANKGTPVPAEPVEPRTEPKGNPEGQSTRRTQDRESVSQAADRIRQFVHREPGVRLTTLLHHVTVAALRWAFFELKKDAAAGADGMTWRMYEEGLEGRLADLHDRVHSGAYRARPSRRVHIPKPDGGTRPLGVAARADKIVQKAVAEIILMPIYEAAFLGFSYGFRPGRGAHDALDALAVGLARRKINWVADCDIRKFFDTVSRDRFVRRRPARPSSSSTAISSHALTQPSSRPSLTRRAMDRINSAHSLPGDRENVIAPHLVAQRVEPEARSFLRCRM